MLLNSYIKYKSLMKYVSRIVVKPSVTKKSVIIDYDKQYRIFKHAVFIK